MIYSPYYKVIWLELHGNGFLKWVMDPVGKMMTWNTKK